MNKTWLFGIVPVVLGLPFAPVFCFGFGINTRRAYVYKRRFSRRLTLFCIVVKVIRKSDGCTMGVEVLC